jgi:SNF2 family DNA or RNA helicase
MKTEDYLQLPKLITLVNPVALGPEARAEYEQLERDAVLEIQGQEISAVNAAALTGKLLQFTGGAVYSEAKTWVKAHDAKIEALEELTEALLDENALLFYNFQHEADRILARFPQAVKLHGPEQIEAWNRGEIRLLVAHPASAGHGLNLQAGGRRIIWYGLPWSLELYQQAVARLHRQGQTLPVMNHLLVTQGTVEDDVADVLAGKAKTQDKLMEAVKARFNRLKQEDL